MCNFIMIMILLVTAYNGKVMIGDIRNCVQGYT